MEYWELNLLIVEVNTGIVSSETYMIPLLS